MQGSLVVKVAAIPEGPSPTYPCIWWRGGANQDQFIFVDANGWWRIDDGSTLLQATTGGYAVPLKVGHTWDGSTHQIAVSGYATTSGAYTSFNRSTITVGSASTSDFLNTYIGRWTQYPTALTSAQLQNLVTG